MKIVEHPYDGHDDWVRQYSDIGMKLTKTETGELYDEAIDIFPCPFNYKETDIPIDPDEPDGGETLN